MNSRLVIASLLVLSATFIEGNHPAFAIDVPKTQTTKEFQEKLKPFLGKYCLSCHGSEKPKAGLNLAKYESPESLAKDRKIWQRAAEHVASGEMPPEKSPQPEPAEADTIAG